MPKIKIRFTSAYDRHEVEIEAPEGVIIETHNHMTYNLFQNWGDVTNTNTGGGNITGSVVGGRNVVRDIEVIESNLQKAKDSGRSAAADALAELVTALGASSHEEKSDVLELLAAVSRHVAEAPAPPKPMGQVLKGVLSTVSGLLAAVPSLTALWDKAHALIVGLFS